MKIAIIIIIVFILFGILFYFIDQDKKNIEEEKEKEEQKRKLMLNVDSFLSWYKKEYNTDFNIKDLSELEIVNFFKSLNMSYVSIVNVIEMKIILQENFKKK